VNTDALFQELTALNYDKKAFMYGRVVQKHARHNLCFDTQPQEPDYAAGKGRIVAYESCPVLNQFRLHLPQWFDSKCSSLAGEANDYYNIKTCGIGFHGDGERKIVVAFRVGATLPLHFQWYQNSSPVGERIKLSLHHGDVYMMSEKATGNDWKKKENTNIETCSRVCKIPAIVFAFFPPFCFCFSFI
jgi:alkylated DNA repair dioxygenase AlkB